MPTSPARRALLEVPRLGDLYGAPDDARLARLAARQHGSVAGRQLCTLGYTRRMIRTRAARGRLHRVFPDVYAVGHPRLTVRGRWMAAVLACGPRALLSHRDAARLHGLLRSAGSGPIDVLAATRHELAGIGCHTARDLRPGDATAVDGIPVTGWARTALDLAPSLTPGRLCDLLEQALRLAYDFGALHALLARTRGHHGVTPLRAALAAIDDLPPLLWSDFEASFLAALRDAGVPLPRTNVVVAGEPVDCHWPTQRLVGELDGRRWHGLRRDVVAAAERDLRLQRAGLRVIHITDERWATEPAAVLADVAAMLALAG